MSNVGCVCISGVQFLASFCNCGSGLLLFRPHNQDLGVKVHLGNRWLLPVFVRKGRLDSVSRFAPYSASGGTLVSAMDDGGSWRAR